MLPTKDDGKRLKIEIIDLELNSPTSENISFEDICCCIYQNHHTLMQIISFSQIPQIIEFICPNESSIINFVFKKISSGKIIGSVSITMEIMKNNIKSLKNPVWYISQNL